MPRPFSELATARGDGSYERVFRKIVRADVLILDDWGPEQMTAGQRRDLVEIVDDRYGRKATIITSQLPVKKWYGVIGEGDFNTRVIIEEREQSRVRELMDQIDQRHKTLVFCATQDNAALVRDLINQVKTSSHPNYCERVTADDGAIGDQRLRDFQDNAKTILTILTTSQKLSSGVDAFNVRNIVLMRPIRSMIEFKQIIGRGTRVYEGKDFVTNWDFVKAHENFNDPEWEGDSIDPEPPRPRPVGPKPEPPTDAEGPEGEGGEDEPKAKTRIKLADGKTRAVRYLATTTYWSAEGKPISEQEFMERLFGDLTAPITDEDHLRKLWSDPDTRETFLKRLSDRGYVADRLNDIRRLVDAPCSDLFDVLGCMLFTTDPKNRHVRAHAEKGERLAEMQDDLKELLISILDAHERNGEHELATTKLGQFLTARYGSVGEAKNRLGSLPQIKAAFNQMQALLYSSRTLWCDHDILQAKLKGRIITGIHAT